MIKYLMLYNTSFHSETKQNIIQIINSEEEEKTTFCDYNYIMEIKFPFLQENTNCFWKLEFFHIY